jgi:hypothetical protein
MLNDIERPQSHNWRDVSGLSKATTAQITTIEVTEQSPSQSVTAIDAPENVPVTGESPAKVTALAVADEGSSDGAPPPRLTPKLESIHLDDTAYTRFLDSYIPAEVKSQAKAELARLSETTISQQAMNWLADAESNPPHVQHWDSWGVKKDELVTSQGWKNLWRLGTTERYAALMNVNIKD